ncbi:hypothetical protein ACFFS4_19635 [Kutzneria kofuensis]|uniref:Uncharacterized protein n=1 Tax=Kutzneria kofuensis TaxID=103725 RepID=A0A7W9KE20_9PSEU|nr:hypothetical protein [Kutzneria kofuensis]MBB5890897.1 hypothetical protein [Kutzneria kofuensis]
MGYVDSWTQRYRGVDLGPHTLLLGRLLVRRRAVQLGVALVAAVLVLRVVQFLLGSTSLLWPVLLTALVSLAAGIALVVQRLGDRRIAAAQPEHVNRHEPVDFAAIVGRRTRTLLAVSYVGAALLGFAALLTSDDSAQAVVFLVGVALLAAVTYASLHSALTRAPIAVDHGSLQADELLRVNDARHAALAYPVLLALVTMSSASSIWLLTVYTAVSVVISVFAMTHEPLTPKVPVAR